MVAKKTPAKKAPAKKAVKAPAKKAPVDRKAPPPAKKAAPPKKAPAAPKKVAPAPVAKKLRHIGGDVMRTVYDADLRATVTLDDADRIRALNHEEYWPAGDVGAGEAASAYLGDIASKFDIAAAALSSLNEPVSYFDPRQQDVEYRFSEEKSSFDTATYAFYQTYLNTPVWTAGLTVTVKQGPTRVVAATNTSEQGIDAQMPTTDAVQRYRRLFLTGEKAPSIPRRGRSRASKAVDGDGSTLRHRGPGLCPDHSQRRDCCPIRQSWGNSMSQEFDEERNTDIDRELQPWLLQRLNSASPTLRINQSKAPA